MYMSSCKSEYRVSASVALFDGLYLKLSSPSLLSTVEAAQHSHAEAGKHHQQQEPKSAKHYHNVKAETITMSKKRSVCIGVVVMTTRIMHG